MSQLDELVQVEFFTHHPPQLDWTLFGQAASELLHYGLARLELICPSYRLAVQGSVTAEFLSWYLQNLGIAGASRITNVCHALYLFEAEAAGSAMRGDFYVANGVLRLRVSDMQIVELSDTVRRPVVKEADPRMMIGFTHVKLRARPRPFGFLQVPREIAERLRLTLTEAQKEHDAKVASLVKEEVADGSSV
jgi:hypothetical protein